jgi:hypothetical protein
MQKISSIVLYLLAAISVILAILFFVGGETSDAAGQATGEPRFTALFLSWSYVLFFIAVALTLLFSLYYIITHPKALKGTLVTLAVGAVLVVIAYLLASTEPVPGRGIEDTTESTLKWVGTGLYLTWILGGLAILGIIASEIYRALS